MTISALEIVGYRSIRKIRFPISQLTVLLGGNGVGKTNLYRALELLQGSARGTLAQEIAREGGLGSIFWAGGKNLSPDGSFDPKYRTDGYRRGEGNILRLKAEFDERGEGIAAPSYEVEIGFPSPDTAAFLTEAQVKLEMLAITQRGKSVALMERKGRTVWARDAEGRREVVSEDLLASETALATIAGRPEISNIRDNLTSWRFFHGFRTDADSPLRRPAAPITTPTLASDGSNLAAVFATLVHVVQDSRALAAAIDDAFPGTRLEITGGDYLSFGLLFPQTPKRAFQAHELSDGTLQFLALAGALLSYRLAPFIALNEPETSLHPALLPMLARMIVKASERAQVWVVTHSRELADAIAAESGTLPRQVTRDDDGTWIEGLSQIGEFIDD